jgi:hypothetical protein
LIKKTDIVGESVGELNTGEKEGCTVGGIEGLSVVGISVVGTRVVGGFEGIRDVGARVVGGIEGIHVGIFVGVKVGVAVPKPQKRSISCIPVVYVPANTD